MQLFQKSVINKYLNQLDPAQTQIAYDKFRKFFHYPETQDKIRLVKEEQFQEGFLRELFVNVLGYTINPHADYDLTTEFKNESGSQKAKALELKAEIDKTDKEIDQMVYELYGLTDEEIKIVEESVKN